MLPMPLYGSIKKQLFLKRRGIEGVANAMRLGTKEKASKLISKMGKLLVVANPAHGPEFLEEVRKYV